jgi:hypothetical protein
MCEVAPQEKFNWADKSKLRKSEFARFLDDPSFKDVFNDKFIGGVGNSGRFFLGPKMPSIRSPRRFPQGRV